MITVPEFVGLVTERVVGDNLDETRLPQAAGSILSKAGIEVVTNFHFEYENQTRETLESEPVLIVSQHTGLGNRQIQPLAPFAYIGEMRNNSKFLINAGMERFFPGLYSDPHYLPLYPNTMPNDPLGFITNRVNIGSNNLSDLSRNKLNLTSLEKATKNINQGGATMIFPDGLDRSSRTWGSGIGHIISLVDNPSAHLVFAYMPPLKPDFLISRSRRIEINFSPPISLESFRKGRKDTKVNTLALKKIYQNWARSL